ncbi:MAG: putative Signal transduction histidine kinase [Promethearchaeota archaeon]|nr:MAG: putative Signal transduction histidine kinase [Candidatus Lokiarchaeota archaeon]
MKYNKEEIRARYRDLFQNSLDFIYVHDLKGNFLDANRIALNKFGYTAEEIKNIRFPDLLEDKTQLRKALDYAKEIVQKGRQSTRSQYKIKTKNGDIKYIETYGIPLKKNGETYAILGIGTDITARKIAQQHLRESEIRYRNLFEKSPYAIGLINSKGMIIDCNPTLETFTGYKREEIVNTHFTKLPILKDEDIPHLISLFQKMIKGIHVHRIDIQLKRKDETLFWTNIQASIIHFDNQPYLQVIIHDISKRKEAELLIGQELEKLKELDETRKNLMIRISHELKTPLMLITGGLEYIKEHKEVELDKDSEEVIGSIERASNRLKKLIENLIDSSKVDYNKLILEKKPYDIVEVINSVLLDLQYLIQKRKLFLTKSLPEKVILPFDKLRIQQVLTNLLLNAIKNSPPNGRIEVKLKLLQNSIEFRLKDTGIGLTEEELSKLFTRFGKIERENTDYEFIDMQGSGLGLFISKAIIDLHGGKIWAKSNGRNEGASFIFQLPRK